MRKKAPKAKARLPIPKYISNFPFKPDEKRPARITNETSAQHVYGFEDHWNEVYTFVSTDKITFSLFYLPPGQHIDPAGCHQHGDEHYHIIQGEAVVLNPETGTAIFLQEGDTLYTPQATRHQMFNFSDQVVGVLSVQAPIAWRDDGMGTTIPSVEEPRFFVPGIDMERSKFDGSPF